MSEFEVQKIKHEYKKSYFLPELYDESIIGFDIISDTIIYDYRQVLEINDWENDIRVQELKNFVDGGDEFFEWFKGCCNESKSKGLVHPVLFGSTYLLE